MSSLVSYLEERGYLQRVDDPTDGRAYIIQRTMRGWEVEQTARKSIRQLEADWALLLGEQFQQLRKLLRKLINATKP